MRISITDRCNLRCLYCMPEGLRPFEFREILTYEEITRIVKVAAGLGVRKVRLTGGEPLARKNVQHLIRSIKEIPGIEELSLTTNGLLLSHYAREIRDSGLDRVNVSLDSLRPERYREITGGGDLTRVLEGLREAEGCGLVPVKVNVVVIRGINDDEIEDFGRFSMENPYQIRFIEFMPGRGNRWSADRCVPSDEIRSRIERLGSLEPVRLRRHGPARYYRFAGGEGIVGFISAVSHHFCGECNRLRITPDGKIRPCLFSETEIDLKAAIRMGADDGEIERLLRLSVAVKPEGHRIGDGSEREINRSMSKIGG